MAIWPTHRRKAAMKRRNRRLVVATLAREQERAERQRTV